MSFESILGPGRAGGHSSCSGLRPIRRSGESRSFGSRLLRLTRWANEPQWTSGPDPWPADLVSFVAGLADELSFGLDFVAGFDGVHGDGLLFFVTEAEPQDDVKERNAGVLLFDPFEGFYVYRWLPNL